MWRCKSKIDRVGQQAGDPGKNCSPNAVFWQNSSLRKVSLCSIKALIDWVRLTHIREGKQLYSKSTIQIFISFKNTLTEKSKIMFNQIYGHWLFCQVDA